MVAIAKRLASAHKMSLLQREHFKATHDPLTGLINQVTLDQRIDHEIALGARYNKSFALLIVEVDSFHGGAQQISKSFANKLFIDFAKRLQNCVRSTDTVARCEDNVFAILLPDVSSVRNIVKVIQSINIDLLSPFSVDDKELILSPTIGISLYPNDGETRQQLVEQANIAMCSARNDEIKNYRYYATDIDAEIAGQIFLEEKIRSAIDSHGYDIHYQPVHLLESGVTSYVEAVVHWSESELCGINSDHINSAVESMELGKLFADITLNEICQQILIWEAGRAHTKVPVLFKVTSSQFKDLDLVNRFKLILKNQNVSPDSIAIAIDESIILDDIGFAIQHIKALKQVGFKIVVDNFSSGLSYIGKLSDNLVDLIRIDSQMVDELDDCMDWLCVVEGIVRIAQNLKIEAVISGINNIYQYKTLQTISGAYWQGDYSYLMGNTEERNRA
ncbi:EAL domain-containing protein [Kaarinaea lacus]